MKPHIRERELLFEELVRQHSNLVYYVAQNWCGDVQEAEELVQETFLRAYLKFDSFTVGTNFKAWVLKILRNLFVDTRRKKKLMQVPLDSIVDPVSKEPVEWEVIDLENQEIFYDLFSDEIVQILQKLSKEYQVCLLLCDVEGLNYQEIADILDCPIGTVRSRIHRARIEFQTHLKNYARQIGYLKEPNG